jgi:hypothetical protein
MQAQIPLNSVDQIAEIPMINPRKPQPLPIWLLFCPARGCVTNQ